MKTFCHPLCTKSMASVVYSTQCPLAKTGAKVQHLSLFYSKSVNPEQGLI